MRAPTFSQAHTIRFLIILLPFLITPTKPDPDLLTDYCIADATTARPFFLPAIPCIDPSLALPSHFATSVLSRRADPSANPFGFNATLTTPTSLPGSNAQGLSMARLDLAPAGHAPLHSHPRASEVALLLQGHLLVGFVDTSGRLFAQQLRAGDAFVFPKGMPHFLYNLDASRPAVAVAGLNSQSPGVQLLAMAALRSEPAVPEEVLKKTFQVSEQDIQRIEKNLRG